MSGEWSPEDDDLLAALVDLLTESGFPVTGVVPALPSARHSRTHPRVEFTNPDGSLGHASVLPNPYRSDLWYRVANGANPTFGTIEDVRGALERGATRSEEATNGELLLLTWRRSRVAPEAVRAALALFPDPDVWSSDDAYFADLLEHTDGSGYRATVLAVTGLLRDVADGVAVEWAVRRARSGRDS